VNRHPLFHNFVSLLEEEGLDALLLNTQANVSYAAGFHAPDSYAVISRKSVCVITDFRYTADFRRAAGNRVTIREYKKSPFDTICEHIVKQNIRKLGFESRYLSFAECEILNRKLAKRTSFIPLAKTLEALREIKSAVEIARIRQAARITLKTLSFARQRLKPGTPEQAIAGDIERFVRLHGAESTAFETIVASGPNSSYPHARVSRRRLQEGDPVIIDMGVEYEGYKCDLTRTFFLGKINPIVQKAAEIVRQAQLLAIQTIKPGIAAKAVDAAARNYIAKQGFGKNFGHSLGHGVGLEVHEGPSLNKKNPALLKPGMVFTVEPGIYLAGRFGIRMEETVLVTATGVEVISADNRN